MKLISTYTLIATTLFSCFGMAELTATNRNQGFAVYGAGAKSCGEWTELRKDKYAFIDTTQWVLGYLSAFTALNASGIIAWETHETNGTTISAWLDKYCKENPLKTISAASSQLLVELMVDPPSKSTSNKKSSQ